MMQRPITPVTVGSATLRELARGDLENTLKWRNDDDSRSWFHYTEVIGPEQHQAWFDAYQAKTDDVVFVLDVDGVPCAQVALYDIADASAEFGRLVVDPDARGKGFGHLAMEMCLVAAKHRLGLSSVYLEVKDDNERAIAVYERAGFERAPERPAPAGSSVWVRSVA